MTRRAPLWSAWGWRLIGVLLLGVILWQVGVREVLGVLVRVDPLAVAGGTALGVAMLLVRAIRWRVLCGGLGLDVGLSEAVRVYLVGTFAAAATPGRVGDIVKAYYVRHRRAEGGLAAGIASVVYDRLLDLGQVCALGLGAVVVLPMVPEVWGPRLAAVALLGFAAGSAWRPVREELVARPMSWALERFPGADGVAPPALPLGSTVAGQALTLLALALFAGEVVLLARGLAISGAGAWELLVLAALGTLVGLLPVTVFGIGTRDALFIAAAPVLGESAEALLGLSLLLLAMAALHGMLGGLAWLSSPPSARRPPGLMTAAEGDAGTGSGGSSGSSGDEDHDGSRGNGDRTGPGKAEGGGEAAGGTIPGRDGGSG